MTFKIGDHIGWDTGRPDDKPTGIVVALASSTSYIIRLTNPGTRNNRGSPPDHYRNVKLPRDGSKYWAVSSTVRKVFLVKPTSYKIIFLEKLRTRHES